MTGPLRRKSDCGLSLLRVVLVVANSLCVCSTTDLAKGGLRPEVFADRRIAGEPDLRISQVRVVSQEPAESAEVEIRWTAQMPALTRIEGFEIVLDVRYGDGSHNTVRSNQLKAHARSAILRLPHRSRLGSNLLPKYYKANIRLRFTATSTLTITRQLSVAGGGNIKFTEMLGGAPLFDLSIISARLVADSCTPGEQCIDLKWSADVSHNIGIHQFTIKADVLYKDESRVSDSKTLPGDARQARLQAGPTDSEIDSINLSLSVTYSQSESRTAVNEGTFS